jgi:asparagine synthase (glutamine-hydrolysing)
VPLAQWFRVEIKEIAQRYLIDEVEGLATVFDLQQVSKVWSEHQHEQRDNSTILWSMLMFEMWWQRYMK